MLQTKSQLYHTPNQLLREKVPPFMLRTKVLAKTHNQVTSPQRSEMNYALTPNQCAAKYLLPSGSPTFCSVPNEIQAQQLPTK